MVINGKRYTNDLLILPENISDGWWRKEGHGLHVEDLREIFKQEPKPKCLFLVQAIMDW